MNFRKGLTVQHPGRPRHVRAWAKLLKAEGREILTLHDGTQTDAQSLIAKLTIMALITGRVDFPRLKGDRRKPRSFVLSGQDWLRFLDKTRDYLDGSVLHAEFEDGEEAEGELVTFYIPDNGREPLTLPSVESDPPTKEDQ